MNSMWITLALIVFVLVMELSIALRKTASNATETFRSGNPMANFGSSYVPVAYMFLPILVFALLILAIFVEDSLFIQVALVFVYGIAKIGLTMQSKFLAQRAGPIHSIAPTPSGSANEARFVFYFSAPQKRDALHVTMWQDALASLGFPYLIIVKDPSHLDSITPGENCTIMSQGDLIDPSVFIPSGVRAVFYANNSTHNMRLLRSMPNLAHIQLLHGDSDKPPSYNPITKAFDYIFVSGEMAIDRYKMNNVMLHRDKFRIVGRPQNTQFKPKENRTRTLVYMTTWSGFFEDSNFSSFPSADQIVADLLSVPGIDKVIFKPHPYSDNHPKWASIKAAVERAAANSKTAFHWADRTEDPFELYAKADVLISDISSTIIDYLYSGKPYIVTNPQGFSSKELERYPSVAGGYLCDPDGGNVGELVELALGDDPMVEKRKEVQNYAFGDLGRPPGEAFKEACYEILGMPDQAQ